MKMILFSPVEPEWVSYEVGTSPAKFGKEYVRVSAYVIARAEYGGTKVVGKFWTANGKFGFVDVKGKRRNIRPSVIEILKTPAAGFEWLKGSAGESPPSGAIVSGETSEGSPLYVVKIGKTPGYYDPSSGCGRVYPGGVACETGFEYLKFNGEGKFIFCYNLVSLYSYTVFNCTSCSLHHSHLCS